jgi:hypothetical protein
MCQTLSFVFDLLCLRFSMLPGSPLDFGALDKRIGQRAIARKNQCDLGKSCPSHSFFGLLHQAGAVESYTISSVFLEKMRMPSSAQLSIPVLQEAGNYKSIPTASALQHSDISSVLWIWSVTS